MSADPETAPILAQVQKVGTKRNATPPRRPHTLHVVVTGRIARAIAHFSPHLRRLNRETLTGQLSDGTEVRFIPADSADRLRGLRAATWETFEIHLAHPHHAAEAETTLRSLGIKEHHWREPARPRVARNGEE